jgi:hypothetical protein
VATSNPYDPYKQLDAGTLVEAGVSEKTARTAVNLVKKLATGRPAPVVMTQKFEAAKRHRAKAYAQRNELVAMMARLWGGHVMPVGNSLERLSTNRVICIHDSPVGQLCYVVTEDEVKNHFADLTDTDAAGNTYTNHWDGTTIAQRSERIAKITAASIAPAPAPKGARKRTTKRNPKRLTANRARALVRAKKKPTKNRKDRRR